MEKFEKVSLNDLSVQDLLLIIKAFSNTYQDGKLMYCDLRNNLVKELCFLTQIV